jgi:hypothetical protein
MKFIARSMITMEKGLHKIIKNKLCNWHKFLLQNLELDIILMLK